MTYIVYSGEKLSLCLAPNTFLPEVSFDGWNLYKNTRLNSTTFNSIIILLSAFAWLDKDKILAPSIFGRRFQNS